MKNYFSFTDPIPDDLKFFLVCKCTCASCSSSYIGDNCRHCRIEEHMRKDKKSHIFKHLHSITTCFESYNYLSFKIIDKDNSNFDLKIKEALHISWRKPNLNPQQNHLALTPLLQLSFPWFFFLFVMKKCTTEPADVHLNSVMEAIRNHSVMKNIGQIQNTRRDT